MDGTEEKLLSVKKVAETVDLSVREIWRLVAAHEFPQPVHIGRSTRWFWSDIKTYLGDLKRGRHD